MGNVEIPKWLKGLPWAPEFRPTDTEFSDPIAYISKIEKEASAFGICKIIPPLPKPSKKYVFRNLNKSLSKCPELGGDVDMSKVCSSSKIVSADSGTEGEARAVFTTRQQELGQSGKRVKGGEENPPLGVHRQVWQSGEIYTLEQFEAKSKAFAKNMLGMIKDVSPLVIEALLWKVASEKPIYVEYANDVPGSGFGEPEDQFRYFHRSRRRRRRRRKEVSCRKREISECKKNEVANSNNSNYDEIKDGSIKNETKEFLNVPGSSTNSLSTSSNETSHPRQKNVHATNDMEATAGWKLSNSPWNLQVISRSPGSLTRFMPDDIPGVTSPMVYIGMLFSWFAWHVEDHELHSMNFLHTGSSKTWYAVPGDYALAFEEAIRTEAYGGNIDRLAALSLLGEKTTLLSPELVVASGIPCCRLVQNAGEFVVTFPRAYHAGFSHGFNCGEAANFGTPQWLQVAKEAAVRRAAMNHLPMLSHQQLLYVLTMSFVSRVPRSFLPGARSSRLRDRQREERELLVKKAFIEDMINENNLLSVLLGRGSTCQAVIWDPDLLPYLKKDTDCPNVNTAVSTLKQENVRDSHSENCNQNILLDEMNLYMECLDDLYLYDDDLSCDFELDSGTLACVACGILGYPFMSVVQPSERASMELLSGDYLSFQEPIISEAKTSHSLPGVLCSVEGSVSGSLSPMDDALLPVTMLDKGWNTSQKYLRPRIFCLEHAVQIEELMLSKGGANIMVICHSDYQRIKAHAAAVAEEIGSTFNYNDIPLSTALEEDLNLISIAIEDEEHAECGEDWTSKLGINLRHCVNVRKNFPCKQIQHALRLAGLFSEKSCSSDLSNIKWKSRRSRSNFKLDHPSHSKQCNSVELKEGVVLAEDGNIVKKEPKIIQYSRRKKSKPDSSTQADRDLGCPNKDLAREDLADTLIDKFHCPDNSGVLLVSGSSAARADAQLGDVENSCVNGGVHDFIASDTELQQEIQATLQGHNGENISCDNKLMDKLNTSPICKSREDLTRICAADDFSNDLSLEAKAQESRLTAAKSKEKPVLSSVTLMNLADSSCGLTSENKVRPQEIQTTDTSKHVPKETDKSKHEMQTSSVAQMAVDQLIILSLEKCSTAPNRISAEELHTHAALNIELQRDIQDAKGAIMDEVVFGSNMQLKQNQPSPTLAEACSEVPMETCAREMLHDDDRCKKDLSTKEINEEESVSCCVTAINKLTSNPIQKYSRVRKEKCAAGNMHNHTETSSSPDSREHGNIEPAVEDGISKASNERKRKREAEDKAEKIFSNSGFIRSPCEGLRPRARKDAATGIDVGDAMQGKLTTKEAREPSISSQKKKAHAKAVPKESHRCVIENCRLSFDTKEELRLHKRNRCPHKGCGKKFRSHKYAVLHQRVHEDDRPLKCPWKGCSMSFKWAWARTEHIRVHTGEKPYQCKVEGCGLYFRFVSDFSRHRRKTGHYFNSSS